MAKIPKAGKLSKVNITQLDSLPNNTELSIKRKLFKLKYDERGKRIQVLVEAKWQRIIVAKNNIHEE